MGEENSELDFSMRVQKQLELSLKQSYSQRGCQCRLNKGGTLFRRTRYQEGSLKLEERKRGPAVWVYRWWEKDINGKAVRRKEQLGTLEEYPNESKAQAATDALRLTVNNQSKRRDLRRTSINTLWEHYSTEELPLKELSTQDAYIHYTKNWILPRWGNLLLDEVKTVEVERWLRATDPADGTKAKIKCVMSALFSHAVRWEFCGHNPISSGMPVGGGGQARAEYGRARKCKTATCAAGVAGRASQVGSCEPGVPRPAPGVPDRSTGDTSRRGGSVTLDGLRLRKCSLLRSTLLLLAQGWPSQGDQDGGVGKALADASGAEECPGGVEGAKPLQHGFRFCISVPSPEGTETTGPELRVEAEDQTCVCEARNRRRGLAHVPSYRWDVAGRHGRTSAYDSRLPAAQQSQSDQQVFASDVEDQASRPGEIGRRDPAHGIIVREQIKPGPVILHAKNRRSCGSSRRLRGNVLAWRAGFLIGPKWTQIADWVLVECLYLVERYGGDDETRTRDLCRDRAAF